MSGVRRELLGLASALLVLAAVAPSCSAAETVPDCGGLGASFEFNEDNELVAAGVYPSVPPRQQGEFIHTFCAEVDNVKSYFVQQQWLPAQSPSPLPERPTFGSYLPRSDLQVFVSNGYKLSQSLVPAWSTQRGRMLFPAAEAIAGEAAIAHELTHVYFPNGNRMLAEGLAVYLQHKIGKNPAFPNFGLDLNQMVRDFTCPRGPAPNGLDKISLVAINRIATPDVVSFRVGRRLFDLGGDVYPVAGSFVQFLIESVGASETPDTRMEKFRKLYMQTPLIPLERDPGEIDRWAGIYGDPLATLEMQWKRVIGATTCSP
jgi:hypothetical protein